MYLIPQSNRSNELSSVGWELLRKYGKYLTTHLATISTPLHRRSVFPRMGGGMPVPFCRRTTPVGLDESGCPLADHDRWSGRVPGRHLSKPRFSLHYPSYVTTFQQNKTLRIPEA